MFFCKTAKSGNKTPPTLYIGGGWVALVDSEGTFPIIKLYIGRVRVLALNHASELVGNLTLCLYDSKEKVVFVSAKEAIGFLNGCHSLKRYLYSHAASGKRPTEPYIALTL